jgi:hypothetical protein
VRQTEEGAAFFYLSSIRSAQAWSVFQDRPGKSDRSAAIDITPTNPAKGRAPLHETFEADRLSGAEALFQDGRVNVDRVQGILHTVLIERVHDLLRLLVLLGQRARPAAGAHVRPCKKSIIRFSAQ